MGQRYPVGLPGLGVRATHLDMLSIEDMIKLWIEQVKRLELEDYCYGQGTNLQEIWDVIGSHMYL